MATKSIDESRSATDKELVDFIRGCREPIEIRDAADELERLGKHGALWPSASALRAARATQTLRHYCKLTKRVECRAWMINTMKFVELCEECCADKCTEPAVRRIAVNCWGVVYEFDVCAKHADRHGKWIETL